MLFLRITLHFQKTAFQLPNSLLPEGKMLLCKLLLKKMQNLKVEAALEFVYFNSTLF